MAQGTDSGNLQIAQRVAPRQGKKQTKRQDSQNVSRAVSKQHVFWSILLFLLLITGSLLWRSDYVAAQSFDPDADPEAILNSLEAKLDQFGPACRQELQRMINRIRTTRGQESSEEIQRVYEVCVSEEGSSGSATGAPMPPRTPPSSLPPLVDDDSPRNCTPDREQELVRLLQQVEKTCDTAQRKIQIYTEGGQDQRQIGEEGISNARKGMVAAGAKVAEAGADETMARLAKMDPDPIRGEGNQALYQHTKEFMKALAEYHARNSAPGKTNVGVQMQSAGKATDNGAAMMDNIAKRWDTQGAAGTDFGNEGGKSNTRNFGTVVGKTMTATGKMGEGKTLDAAKDTADAMAAAGSILGSEVKGLQTTGNALDVVGKTSSSLDKLKARQYGDAANDALDAVKAGGEIVWEEGTKKDAFGMINTSKNIVKAGQGIAEIQEGKADIMSIDARSQYYQSQYKTKIAAAQKQLAMCEQRRAALLKELAVCRGIPRESQTVTIPPLQ